MTRHLVALVVGAAAAAGCTAPEAPWLTDPGIEGHSAYFLLAGTAHDPGVTGATVTCEGCHPGTTFKAFVCTTCHPPAATDPVHTGLAGYHTGTVTNADCRTCHPDGTGITSANHALFFPIGTPSHPAVCTQCHTDPANRTDPSRLACAACHAQQAGFATVHANVKDYPLSVTSPWCLRCHADSQVDRIAAHGRLPGAPGSGGPGDGRHDTHCFQCHTMIPPLPLFGGTGAGVPNRPWAQDWTQAACSKCH
jgi:hypothetical protein